jgi:2'-5' RNA ligase
MNGGLQQLQKEVLLNYSNQYPKDNISKNEKDFHPHITVAYRDLKPATFHQAWQEYSNKEYYAAFKVDDFHLLQHDSKHWNVISTLKLHSL